jgi:hypothetical protein
MHCTCPLGSLLQPLTAPPTRLTATEWLGAPRGTGDAFIANMATRTSKQSEPVWVRPAPKKGGTTHLDPEHRAKARQRAARAGRHYPNMVDNIREAADQKASGSRRRKAAKTAKKTTATKTTRRRVAKKKAAKRSARKSSAAKRRATKRKSS